MKAAEINTEGARD